MKSIPEGYVRKEYSCKGWLPLVTDRAGNYLGVDLSPGDGGTFGQVIVFGRDFDTKVVMWRGEGEGGWGRWLAGVVDELENGEGYELGNEGGGSDGSEDEVGYESYFYSSNGVTREGGEGHTGGLRLTGEYKGWNVLEAWADRSLKRWIQAGLYKEPEQPQAPLKSDADMADSNLVSDAHPATEVPIPGLTVTTSTSDRDVTEVTPTTPRARDPPPAIAVVPPIPMPVPIPTAKDLLTNDSPDSSQPVSPKTPQQESTPIPALVEEKSRPTARQSRMASEDSMDGSESGAMLALTGRHSVESMQTEEEGQEESSPMTEAHLVAPVVANEEKKISPAPSIKENQKRNGALAVQTSAPSNHDDSGDMRTPTATSFANGITGEKPEPTKDVAEPSSSPTSTRVGVPGDERPTTHDEHHHKKHSLSISKLFHHHPNAAAAASGSGSDDDSIKHQQQHHEGSGDSSRRFSGFRLKGHAKKKGSESSAV